MRRRIAITAALLGLLSWKTLAPTSGDLGPLPRADRFAVEQLWVPASHVVSSTDPAPERRASPAPAPLPSPASAATPPDSADD